MVNHSPKSRARAKLSRSFWVVQIGEGTSLIGDAAFSIALAWIALGTTGSVGALAGVMLAQAIPRGVLMLFGGAITDRTSARTVMVTCHALRAVLLTVLAGLVLQGAVQLWHLYAAAVVTGVTAAFFAPAAESVLPDLVPDEAFARGNAVQGAVGQAASLVGPILGGALTAASPGLAVAANAATYVVAAATATAIPPRSRANTTQLPVLTEIANGVRHAWASRETRLVLLIVSVATLSYSGLFAVGLPTLASSFSHSSLALGILVTAWGLGQLVGTLAAAVTGLPRRWGVLIIAMTFAEALAFSLLGLAPSAWVGAAILMVLGVGVAYSSDVALPTFIQSRTPRHLLGRISSLVEFPRVVLEPVSIALLGLVLSRSVAWGFAAAALPVLALGLYMLASPFARGLSASADQVHQ